MFKVIVAGGRDFNNYDLLKSKLDILLANRSPIEIVSGTARGADKLGELYAKKSKLSLALFPADWEFHGKSAGYKRNAQMADYADALVAFWDGKSRGTMHMINLAKSAGIHVRVVNY